MLQLVKLRELGLSVPPQPGRPAHLSAASGLVRTDKFIYVVADDEYHLGVFPAHGQEPGVLLRLRDGDLPSSYAERKARKPDLEALTLLPTFDQYPQGALLAFGSGSRPNRCAGFLLGLDARGAIITKPRMIDLTGMFSLLEDLVGAVNIEGIAISGDRLRLLHRGNKREGRNAIIEFALGEFLSALRTERGVANLSVRALATYDLGTINEVPLAFTDGVGLADGSLLFTAIAEDSSDSYADGRFLGAAIGLIDARGELMMLRSIAERLKIEGIDAHQGNDSIELLLTTDADDADVPASLYQAELHI